MPWQWHTHRKCGRKAKFARFHMGVCMRLYCYCMIPHACHCDLLVTGYIWERLVTLMTSWFNSQFYFSTQDSACHVPVPCCVACMYIAVCFYCLNRKCSVHSVVVVYYSHPSTKQCGTLLVHVYSRYLQQCPRRYYLLQALRWSEGCCCSTSVFP